MAPSELGCGPQPYPCLGRGEGQGELRPPDVWGIRAAFFPSHAEPPEAPAASKGICCPLLLAQRRPCSDCPVGLGLCEEPGQPLELGFLPSTITSPPKASQSPTMCLGARLSSPHAIPDAQTPTDRRAPHLLVLSLLSLEEPPPPHLGSGVGQKPLDLAESGEETLSLPLGGAPDPTVSPEGSERTLSGDRRRHLLQWAPRRGLDGYPQPSPGRLRHRDAFRSQARADAGGAAGPRPGPPPWRAAGGATG